LLLQRRSILLREKTSARTKQQRANEKTFHAKVREDETACLKCKLRMLEDRQRIVPQVQTSGAAGHLARSR
jgi:hypothetical protein